jgi:hypothetical protein
VQVAAEKAIVEGAKAIIVAADLAQLKGIASNTELRRFIATHHATPVHLTECYRQREAAGELAKRFLASIRERFSKHHIPSRIEEYATEHSAVLTSMNALTFTRPGGWAALHDPATAEIARGELKTILHQSHWSHWPSLLIVTDASIDPRRVLGRDLSQLPYEVIAFTDLDGVKGLEYQHVFVMLPQQELHRLLYFGQRGLGTAEYNELLRLRISFTRAVERLIVFSFP